MLKNEEFGYLEFRITDFEVEKEHNKFVKAVESLIRRSPEYKLWVNYIKDTQSYNYCFFTNEIGEEVTIDIHHHPFTLYDLVVMAVDDKISKEIPFASVDIMEEILKLHYEDKVGYIPMIRTLHEKYHNGFLDIPISIVLGNWKELFKLYPDMSPDIKDKVSRLASIDTVATPISWAKDAYLVNKIEIANAS